MNTETQMVIDRIKADAVSVRTIDEIKEFVESAVPHIFGDNGQGQWSWRIAREQKERVDWEEILKWV